METRGKGKGASAMSDTELSDARSQALMTREYELNELERSVGSKEERIRAQEIQLRQQLEEIDFARLKLEEERKRATQRECELTKREQDLEKKWIVGSLIPPLDTINANRGPYNAGISHQNSPNNTERRNSNNNNNSNTQSTPHVSFREATESVPNFDGYNIPLRQFTRACRRARELVPAGAERDLTKLLINKLNSRAYYAVEDEPCNTITELIDLLTDAFDSPKTIDQYRGELSIIYMKPGEHVLDYVSRTKDLRASILNVERRNRGSLEPHFVAEIDDLTARSFCQGLTLEYRLQISEETRARCSDVFRAARIIAKRLELDKLRSHENLEQRRSSNFDRPLAQSTPQRSNYPLDRKERFVNPNLNRNNAPGYAYEPRTPRISSMPHQNSTPVRDALPRSYSTSPQDPPPQPRYTGSGNMPQQSYATVSENPASRDYPPASQRGPLARNTVPLHPYTDHAPTKFCRYCKTPGHVIDECRKRQYNNQQSQIQGNAVEPSEGRGAPAIQDGPITRPMNVIEPQDKESNEYQSPC